MTPTTCCQPWARFLRRGSNRPQAVSCTRTVGMTCGRRPRKTDMQRLLRLCNSIAAPMCVVLLRPRVRVCRLHCSAASHAGPHAAPGAQAAKHPRQGQQPRLPQPPDGASVLFSPKPEQAAAGSRQCSVFPSSLNRQQQAPGSEQRGDSQGLHPQPPRVKPDGEPVAFMFVRQGRIHGMP